MLNTKTTTLFIAILLGAAALAHPAPTADKPLLYHVGDVAEAKGPPSEAVIKAYIQRGQDRIATGVGSSPKTSVATFESIKMGTPRPTNAHDRGANGVTGDRVYPVRTKFSVLQTWGNGETEVKQWNYDYDFYLDSYGEWTAISVGPVR